jgi:hypothetical protein
VLSETDKRVRHHLTTKDLMGIHRSGMFRRAIPTLLDVDRTIVERDGLDRAQLLATQIPEFFPSSNFGFLWRIFVSMDGSTGSPADICNERQT